MRCRPVKGQGHLARFVDEFEWDSVIEFSNFSGTLTFLEGGMLVAKNEYATLPVEAQLKFLCSGLHFSVTKCTPFAK